MKKRKFTYGGRKVAREHGEKCLAEGTRNATAWHETGHAIAHEYFDFPIEWVSCEPFEYEGRKYHGYTYGVQSNEQEVHASRGIYAIMGALAGIACEWHKGTMKRGMVDPEDFENALTSMRRNDLPCSTYPDVELWINTTEEFLEWAWDVVSDLAELLRSQGRVEGDVVREMVRSRLGYIPAEKQIAGLFEGVVILPGTEASERELYLREATEKEK